MEKNLKILVNWRGYSYGTNNGSKNEYTLSKYDISTGRYWLGTSPCKLWGAITKSVLGKEVSTPNTSDLEEIMKIVSSKKAPLSFNDGQKSHEGGCYGTLEEIKVE